MDSDVRVVILESVHESRDRGFPVGSDEAERFKVAGLLVTNRSLQDRDWRCPETCQRNDDDLVIAGKEFVVVQSGLKRGNGVPGPRSNSAQSLRALGSHERLFVAQCVHEFRYGYN